MINIKVVQNDVGYDINFTLRDANDAVVDLTNGTLLFKAQKQGVDTIKFSGSMSIVAAVSGTCKYTVASGDFDEVGDYYAEIQVTYSGGKVVTFGDIVVHVKPEIPR